MKFSFRKRQPIPELHIDEAARDAAAVLDKSDPVPGADADHLSMVDQMAQIRLQEVRTLNEKRSGNLNQI
jgi:hypothetical protein